MLPPPAPTSAMSIVGILSSSPAPRISRLPADIDAADLVLAAARDGAVLDQRRLRGRAAHVEGEQVVDAELLAHPAGGDDTGCGTRFEREDRPLLRVVRGHHAA